MFVFRKIWRALFSYTRFKIRPFAILSTVLFYNFIQHLSMRAGSNSLPQVCNIIRTLLAASIYLCKVKNGNTSAMCEICSKLTIKILESFY